jgi:hypothetical protein
MRGRTLNHSFIILDEAQNTTPEQMKMFLTRIGFGTKAVITGDVTQIDLARGQKSGLIEASASSNGVRGIAFVKFTSADVVRHPLVQKIIDAYERHDAKKPLTACPPVPLVSLSSSSACRPTRCRAGARCALGRRGSERTLAVRCASSARARPRAQRPLPGQDYATNVLTSCTMTSSRGPATSWSACRS